MSFGGGSPPKPQPVVSPPQVEDKAVQDAAAEAARRRKTARGFKSTILGSSMPSGSSALKDTLGS